MIKEMWENIEKEIDLGDTVEVTSIFNHGYDGELKSIQIQTKKGNYIEIYNDGTWNYFPGF